MYSSEQNMQGSADAADKRTGSQHARPLTCCLLVAWMLARALLLLSQLLLLLLPAAQHCQLFLHARRLALAGGRLVALNGRHAQRMLPRVDQMAAAVHAAAELLLLGLAAGRGCCIRCGCCRSCWRCRLDLNLVWRC